MKVYDCRLQPQLKNSYLVILSDGEKYHAADLIQEMCKQLDNPPIELDEDLKRIYDWQKKSLASRLTQAIKMARAHPIEQTGPDPASFPSP